MSVALMTIHSQLVTGWLEAHIVIIMVLNRAALHCALLRVLPDLRHLCCAASFAAEPLNSCDVCVCVRVSTGPVKASWGILPLKRLIAAKLPGWRVCEA